MDKKGAYWLRSGLYSLFEKTSLQIFRFGGFYLLVRGLPKEQYGVWVLFLMVGAFVEVARIGLVQNALMKFLAVNEKSVHGSINTASLVLNTILTGLSMLALIVLSQVYKLFWPDAFLLDKMLPLYIITTLILIPFFQFNFIQQGNLEFRGTFWSNFAREGLFFAYVVASYFTWGLDLVQLASFQIIAAILGSFVAYITTAKVFFLFSKKIDWSWVKELFNFGKYVLGTSMSSMIIKSIDTFMLGSIIGTTGVAIYNVGIKISNLVEVPTQAVAAIVFPQSAKRIEEEGKDSVKRLYERSVGGILALIVPLIFFVLVFPELVLRIIAPEYIEWPHVLQVTVLYGLFIPFARQFGTMLDSIGKPKINFYFVVVGATLNIIFNYFFVHAFGIIGAAYGTLSTYVIIFILNSIVLYKELGVLPQNALAYAPKFYLQIAGMAKGFIKAKMG